MSDLDPQAILDAMADRTPGPWEWSAPDVVQLYSTAEIDEYEADVLSADGCAELFISESNQRAIVTAVNSVEPLCHEVLRLWEEVGRFRSTLDQIEDLVADICPYFTGDDKRRSQVFALIHAALAPQEKEGQDDG